jgi:predicted NUDIX family NTP pyrophosphohydrolase
MAKVSAGLLMYRVCDGELQVLLVHPGGPFWQNKDEGVWTFPRGEVADDEDELAAAKREFHEETGLKPHGPFVPLGSVRNKSGKTIYAWAFEGDCDPRAIRSNTFTLEWPPRSGKKQEFPEIDRAEFFELTTAEKKLRSAEVPLLRALEDVLRGPAKP